jgi:predicted nucleotidyltransferase
MSKRELQGILRNLRRELTSVLGDQLVSVILYGSQARGQARSDSDIDVLVVVCDDSDYGDLIRRTSASVSALSLQHDVVISRAFVSRERYAWEQTPFLLNVRREGVPV